MSAFEEIVAHRKLWVDARRRDGDEGVFRATALALPMPPSVHDALLVPRTERAVVPHLRRKPENSGVRDGQEMAERVRLLTEDGASAFVISTFMCEDGTGYEDILMAAQNTHVPIICSDVVIDPIQLTLARAHGAAAVVLCAHLLQPRALRRLRRVAHELSLQTVLDVSAVRHLGGGQNDRDDSGGDAFRIYGADILCCSSKDTGRFQERLADVVPQHAITIVPIEEGMPENLTALSDRGYNAFVLDATDEDLDLVRAKVRAVAGERGATPS